MALHSKGRLYSNASHYIHKYRSLLFVNNTEHSCYPFPMLPCDLQLNYCFHLFLYYLTSNCFAKSSFLLFPVIWCIRFLLLCNQLLQTKTMHIYLVIFLWSGVQQLGPLLKDSEECNRGVSWAVFMSGSLTGEKSAPKPIRIVVRIHFLVAV